MDYQKLASARDGAEQLHDFLDLSGWKDVLLPAILKHRSALLESLHASALGTPQTLANGSVTPTAAIAGRIGGLDDVVLIINDVLAKGDRAIKQIINSQQPPAG